MDGEVDRVDEGQDLVGPGDISSIVRDRYLDEDEEGGDNGGEEQEDGDVGEVSRGRHLRRRGSGLLREHFLVGFV